tara:strand:+ start:221 stop:616 length:396 start_codon:yes stop_codon:yes gene_type:complete
LSENETPTQEQINAGLAQAIQQIQSDQQGLIKTQNQIAEYLKQKQTASEPQQNDPSDKPITIRTLLAELPNFINLYRQTQTPPSDPMQSVYLEFGRKVVGDTLEQVSKNVFAKPIAKVQTENIKKATVGIQ